MAKLKEDEIGPRTHLVPRDRDKTCNEGRAVATPAESSHFQIIGEDSGEKRNTVFKVEKVWSQLLHIPF